MGVILSYSIVSGLFMLAMYLAYRIFLANDKQYSFNRCVLMLIYFVSFAVAHLILNNAHSAPSEVSAYTIPGNVDVTHTEISTQAKPIWGTVLIWIYITGMAAVTVKTAIIWIRLTNVIRSGEKLERGCYVLVVTDNERYAPFSWMQYVVVSRNDYNDDCSAIEIHELKHITSLHWVDLLIAQFVCIVNWFNPAAWLMRKGLMLIHEYQADMAVISSGHDPQSYQMLLIKKAVGARFPSLANSLNHSNLKKRITMMYKEKSGAGRKIKALTLAPMLALALGVIAVPSVNAAMSIISSSGASINKNSEISPQTKIGNRNFKVKKFNNNDDQTTIVIQGEHLGNNLTVSGGTFTTMGKTYNATAMNCDMSDGSATITIVFPFTSEYENSSMTFNVNGEDITLDLESFLINPQSLKVVGLDKATLKNVEVTGSGTASASASPSDKVEVLAVGTILKSTSAADKDMEAEETSGASDKLKIYLDGKEITEREMNQLPPSAIECINVYKQKNLIEIYSKK